MHGAVDETSNFFLFFVVMSHLAALNSAALLLAEWLTEVDQSSSSSIVVEVGQKRDWHLSNADAMLSEPIVAEASVELLPVAKKPKRCRRFRNRTTIRTSTECVDVLCELRTECNLLRLMQQADEQGIYAMAREFAETQTVRCGRADAVYWSRDAKHPLPGLVHEWCHALAAVWCSDAALECEPEGRLQQINMYPTCLRCRRQPVSASRNPGIHYGCLCPDVRVCARCAALHWLLTASPAEGVSLRGCRVRCSFRWSPLTARAVMYSVAKRKPETQQALSHATTTATTTSESPSTVAGSPVSTTATQE